MRPFERPQSSLRTPALIATVLYTPKLVNFHSPDDLAATTPFVAYVRTPAIGEFVVDHACVEAVASTDEVVEVVIRYAEPVRVRIAEHRVRTSSTFYVISAGTAVQRVITTIIKDLVFATLGIHGVGTIGSCYVVCVSGAVDGV